MTNAHIIIENGRKMVVLPLASYKRMVSLLEEKEEARDAAQAKAILARVRAGKEALLPASVVDTILDGAHPVRAWRDHRGLTAQMLAQKAGISRAYLTQIEGRKRNGSVEVLSALAKALRTSLDALLED